MTYLLLNLVKWKRRFQLFFLSYFRCVAKQLVMGKTFLHLASTGQWLNFGTPQPQRLIESCMPSHYEKVADCGSYGLPVINLLDSPDGVGLDSPSDIPYNSKAWEKNHR